MFECACLCVGECVVYICLRVFICFVCVLKFLSVFCVLCVYRVVCRMLCVSVLLCFCLGFFTLTTSSSLFATEPMIRKYTSHTGFIYMR